MKRFPYSLMILFLSAVLAGCGGQTDELEAKRKQLATLQGERAKLEKQISELEAEIERLDTSGSGDGLIPVKVMAIETKTFQHFIKVQGQVETENNIMVSPKMGGTYTRVLVSEGDPVKQGALLAKVDDAVLLRTVDELQVQLALARSLYEKQRNLWDKEIGSEVQLMQAKTQKEALEQRLATTYAQIDLTEVRSPISGVVENVMAKPGEGAIPGMPAFRVVSLSDLSFKANLSESYIPLLKRGDEVTIEFPSISASIKAKISSIGQTINPTNRTVTVSVDIPANTPNIKANLVGEISINDASREDAITVPQEFLQKGVDGTYVMVAERDKAGTDFIARRVVVTTGLRYQNEVEIVSGLKRGHLIITDGTVGEGEKVSFPGLTSNN